MYILKTVETLFKDVCCWKGLENKCIICSYLTTFLWTEVSGTINQDVEEILKHLYYLLIGLCNDIF